VCLNLHMNLGVAINLKRPQKKRSALKPMQPPEEVIRRQEKSKPNRTQAAIHTSPGHISFGSKLWEPGAPFAGTEPMAMDTTREDHVAGLFVIGFVEKSVPHVDGAAMHKSPKVLKKRRRIINAAW